MEIIEKVKEVEKEPVKEYASKGVAGTGLGLGIAGTALGLLALNNGGGGFSLFGNRGVDMPQNVNINADTAATDGSNFPTSFQAWEKSCEDAIALTRAIYDGRITDIREKQAAREIDVNEKFQLWKSQIDADFGLYKNTRDGFDAINAKQNQDAFNLYKNQRDGFDTLSARIGALETKQAITDAVEPWRAKVLNMQINNVAANANAAVALEAERRCCADNKIVNYVNSTFYPIEVADVTVGTTATARATSNPLCGCCNINPYYGTMI